MEYACSARLLARRRFDLVWLNVRKAGVQREFPAKACVVWPEAGLLPAVAVATDSGTTARAMLRRT